MYQIPELLKYKKLFHAFSLKADGNMANSINGKVSDFDTVIKNRKTFLNKINVDLNKTICMWVTHGDKIIEPPEKRIGVSMTDFKKAVKVDGLITDKKGIYLFLLVADCIPLIIYDPLKEVVALVHAGWKGVDLEIIKKAVKKLNSEYRSKSSDLIVGIGPCVYKNSFIKENPSQKGDLRWREYITFLEGKKFSVDLVGFAKKQLTESGVLIKNIFESSIDTGKDTRFFSHVRDARKPITRQGRFACIVGLKE